MRGLYGDVVPRWRLAFLMGLSAGAIKGLSISLGVLTLTAALAADYIFRTGVALVIVALGLVAIDLVVVVYLNKRGAGASR